MRDDLHALLDGEGTEDIERLFEGGAFGSDEFREFQQHQRLQTELARNGCAGRLTPAESASILGNITAAIGIPQTTATIPAPSIPRRSGGFWRTGLALLAGIGIGYGVNELVAQRQVVLNTEMKNPQPAVVAAPISVTAPNHDSLVRALRDSISTAMSAGPAQVEPSKAKGSSRTSPSRVRKTRKHSGSNDAVTGMGRP